MAYPKRVAWGGQVFAKETHQTGAALAAAGIFPGADGNGAAAHGQL